jgi:ectoine hydroxylase-related dioxygenase (phytanoyl-CoA dioxygenase family)
VRDLTDLTTDLAATHQATPSSGARVEPAIVDADLARLERDGYVVLEDLIDPATCDEIRTDASALLDLRGRNAFEGHLTQRVYSVLAKTRVIDRLVDEPRVLALLDRLLLANHLLSQLQVINLLPGETAQLLHPDDGVYPVPRPRQALGVATIWAIDDFTADNGATVVVPGSHLWGDDRTPVDSDERVSMTMGAGSCVLFLGTLWHGGGANRSSSSRLAVTAQYCEPWLRPQEAFTLSVGRDQAAALSEDLIRLLGYSIHPPFLDMVDGMHPRRTLMAPR